MERKSSARTTCKNMYSINLTNNIMLPTTNLFRIARKPTATIPSSSKKKRTRRKFQPQRKVNKIATLNVTAVEPKNQVRKETNRAQISNSLLKNRRSYKSNKEECLMTPVSSKNVPTSKIADILQEIFFRVLNSSNPCK